MRSSGVVVGLVLLLSPAVAVAATDTLDLPTPEAAQVQSAKLITAVGGRPDRLLASDVPGPVVNDELVRVGIGGDGSVQQVTADQRLRLRGEGDYAIRERGPARSATSLTAEPAPVTRRGAVVWQGFSPGRRDLAARLLLDPQIEATRLPLSVSVSFNGKALEPGGRIPGPGRITVTVRNTTAQPQDLPTARDVSADEVAVLLDRLRATQPSASRLPSTSAGLPRSLRVTGPELVASTQGVPYLLTGSLQLTQTTGLAGGPGTTPVRDGALVRGTLGGSLAGHTSASTAFVVDADGPGVLKLDLRAVAALNQAELAPPRPFASWSAWADAGPSAPSRRQALDLLVAVAATGARASSYSPYLGADLVGSGSTEFRWSFAEPKAAVSAEVLHPKWGPIAVTGTAVALILANLVLIWRRL